MAFFVQRSDAQFKEGAFTQNYNEQGDTLATNDTVAKLFSFKEFIGGLAHKNTSSDIQQGLLETSDNLWRNRCFGGNRRILPS